MVCVCVCGCVRVWVWPALLVRAEWAGGGDRAPPTHPPTTPCKQDAGHNYRLDQGGSALLTVSRKKGGKLTTVLQLLKLFFDRAGAFGWVGGCQTWQREALQLQL